MLANFRHLKSTTLYTLQLSLRFVGHLMEIFGFQRLRGCMRLLRIRKAWKFNFTSNSARDVLNAQTAETFSKFFSDCSSAANPQLVVGLFGKLSRLLHFTFSRCFKTYYNKSGAPTSNTTCYSAIILVSRTPNSNKFDRKVIVKFELQFTLNYLSKKNRSRLSWVCLWFHC